MDVVLVLDIEYLCFNSKIQGTARFLFSGSQLTLPAKPVVGGHHHDVVECHLGTRCSILLPLEDDIATFNYNSIGFALRTVQGS
jgi:hypothetical protein